MVDRQRLELNDVHYCIT